MERVRLVHGNGGRFSHELTDRFILKYFTNDLLAPLHDGAQFPVTAGRMAFSTDSYVVQPTFFPGGNIGKLAVCGTVQDGAVVDRINQLDETSTIHGFIKLINAVHNSTILYSSIYSSF